MVNGRRTAHHRKNYGTKNSKALKPESVSLDSYGEDFLKKFFAKLSLVPQGKLDTENVINALKVFGFERMRVQQGSIVGFKNGNEMKTTLEEIKEGIKKVPDLIATNKTTATAYAGC